MSNSYNGTPSVPLLMDYVLGYKLMYLVDMPDTPFVSYYTEEVHGPHLDAYCNHRCSGHKGQDFSSQFSLLNAMGTQLSRDFTLAGGESYKSPPCHDGECGIYAWHDIPSGNLLKPTDAWGNSMGIFLVAVKAYGQLELHEDGIRAEHTDIFAVMSLGLPVPKSVMNIPSIKVFEGFEPRADNILETRDTLSRLRRLAQLVGSSIIAYDIFEKRHMVSSPDDFVFAEPGSAKKVFDILEEIKEAEGVHEEDGTLVRFREYTESQACKVSQKLRESVNDA